MIEILNDVLALREQAAILAGGLFLLGLGGAVFADMIIHRRRSIELDGRIAGVVNKGDENNPMYYPVIDLLAPGLGALQVTGDSGGDHFDDTSIGNTVRVLYRPDEPELARIVSSSRAILGAVLSVFGIGLLTAFFYAYAASWVSGLIGLAYCSGLSLAFAKAGTKGTVRAEQSLPRATIENDRVAIETIRDANARASRFNKVFSPLLALLGAIVLAGGAYVTVDRVDFISVAEPVQGKITGFERKGFLRGDSVGWSLSVYPIFSFVTKAGETVTVSDDIGSRYPQYQVGESVVILYDPQDPARARIDRGPALWILPGALVAFGLIAFWAAFS
jgi:hypothetical protein